MKNLLYFSILSILLFTSCSKETTPLPPVDESVWLSKERGIVVASDFNCDYFVVQTNRGYTVLRNWGGISPFSGSIIYGDLSNWGVKTLYNRSEGRLINADVRDYWMGYFQAMDQVQWSCGNGFSAQKAN
jgi:hypothetical protein